MANPIRTMETLKRLKTTSRLANDGWAAVRGQAALLDRFVQLVDSDRFSRLWPLIQPHQMNDVWRAAHILSAVEDALSQPGDLIECGVAHGGTSLLIALAVKELAPDRKVYMLDSFEGLPAPDRRFDEAYEEGQFASDVDRVRALTVAFGVEDICVIIPGWFSDTLPRLEADQRFCFAHIDCDLYLPAVECLEHLHPRVNAGGRIVLDDYFDGSDGVLRALNPVLDETGEVLFVGPESQVQLTRGLTADAVGDTLELVVDERGNPAVSGLSVQVSMELLRRDASYRAYLGHLLADYGDRLALVRAVSDDLAD